MADKDDDDTKPPEERPTPPPKGKRALPFEDTGIDWEQEMGAWDAAFPMLEQPTPPGGAQPDEAPPLPDSSELVLDDLAHTPPPLVEQLDDLSEELEIDEDLPGPLTPGPTPEPFPLGAEGEEEQTVTAGPSEAALQGSEPEAPMPRAQESSNVLIIPDVAELEAAATAVPQRLDATPATPVPEPSDIPPRPAPTPRPTGRTLVADGLPDVSELWQRTPTPTAAVEAAGGPFDDELPDEAPVDLRLELPPVSWVWSAAAVAEEVAAGVETGAPLEDDYWKAQLALAVDESAILQRDEQAPPRARAQALLWSARAAERVGRGDALRLYEQVLALDPALPEAAAALRGQFRLLYAAGASAEARDKLVALAAAAPGETAAYRTLLALAREATPPEPGVPSGGGADGDGLEGIPALILAAERAFAAGDRAAAAPRLAELADELGGLSGETLRELAALLAEAGPSDRPAALREGAGAYAQEARGLIDLRAAARQPSEQAREQLTAAASALAGTPLAAAVRRWAARLARRHVQPAPLFSIDEGLPGAEAPWPERLERASVDAFARDVDELAARFDHVPPAAVPLLARRLAQALPDDRRRDGLGLLERAAERDRTGPGALSGDVMLALAAERLAAGADREVAVGAWRLVAGHDPARAAVAHHAQAQLLLSGPDAAGRAAGLEALSSAVSAAPREASFWALSWQQRKQAHADQAGDSLVAGAAAWDAAGAGRIASALRDRAAELDAAARPDALLDRLPARSFPVDLTDDPRQLARELLARASDPAAMAATWKAAATGGSALRVAEAAGWLIEAGKPGEALSWLMDAGSHGERSEALSLYLRRLVRQGDAGSQASVLTELLEALPESTPAMERAELEMLRAEALAGSGRRREAADLYRELLAGPLAGDADLAMRRVLWSLRDGEALESLWRDEHDAQFGAGRVRGAAAALVEKSRVVRDLRGDAAAAAVELRQALEEDPSQPLARVMWLAAMPPSPTGHPSPEVTGLVETLARELPASAVSLHFLAALLAEGQGAAPGAAEAARNNLAAAVERAGKALPITLARRHVAAEQNRTPPDPDLPALLERQADRIAGTPGGDVRLATALLMAAAQLEEPGAGERAEALYGRVLQLEPDYLPALVRLRRVYQGRGQVGPAAELLAREAAVLRGPRKLGRLHAAAALAFEKMDDPARGRGYLEQALAIDPTDDVAFTWLRASLEQQGDRSGVGALLSRRAAVASPAEAAALRLERVDLLAASGADAGAARRELQELLEIDPENVGALRRLAALELGEGNLAAAAALSIRQARYERDPAALVDCFLLIGRLYLQDLQDPKIALGAFERVLRIDPTRPEALDALSELYAHQGETRKALAVTERLVERESDPRRRRPFLLRLGTLWEAAGDTRRAGVMLRRAVDESPRDLQALGELVRFHERQREMPARNVLLDGSLALLREDLRRSPGNLEVLRTMIPVLRWRHRPACAAAAAQLLASFSADAAEKAEAAAWAAAPGRARRLAPLASPELDGRALPAGIQGGIRHLLRVLGPMLHRSMRPDLKRWEVGRAQRLPKGSGVRETLEALAGDLGVRGFDAYVSPSQPFALTVEPGEPPSAILGGELVNLPPTTIRYACGQMARLMETHLDLLLEQGPMEAAILMAAIVRFFLPDYRPAFGEPAAQAAADEQVSRALHRAPRAELAPFASEIAGAFTPESLYADAEEAGARAGLLASGDLAAALQLVAARHGMGRGTGPPPLSTILHIPVAARLVDFALSDDYEELVQALDAVS